MSQIKWKSCITTPRLLAYLAGKSYVLLHGTGGTFLRIQTGTGGTGLLSGGRPQRGHTVECSSSRVTYCNTVLSPVKSIYTHARKARWSHASDIWRNGKVRKDWRRRQGSRRLHNAHGCTLKLGYLCFTCIYHMLNYLISTYEGDKQSCCVQSHMHFMWTEFISSEGNCSARVLLT